MSEYKRFISRDKYQELCNLLDEIADTRGLGNKLHHLYQPDTDMNDKVCEDLTNSKYCILMEIKTIMKTCELLATKVVQIEES